MENETANAIATYAAIFAGLSAIAGIVASIAAFRSSSAAKKLVELEEEKEKRILIINCAKLAQQLLSKARILSKLCDKVKSKYNSLAVFTGNTGSSRREIYLEDLNEHKTQIKYIVQYVEETSIDDDPAENLAVETLQNLLKTYTIKQEELIEIEIELEDSKTEVNSELLIFQNKAINSENT